MRWTILISLFVFSLINIGAVSAEAIPATIDIDSNTLNLDSKGESITCYIELPSGYDVGEIDVGTVKLNGAVPAEEGPTAIDDYDNDGVPDLMVKFDRASVIGLLLGSPDLEVNLKTTGNVAGASFEGTDMIRIPKPKEATFVLSNLVIEPPVVKPSEPVTVSVDVTNIGRSDGEYTVILKINNTIGATQVISVEATKMKEEPITDTVTFTVTRDTPGTYTVEVDGLTGSFEVFCTDSDGDGYNVDGGSCGPVDCDDTDANFNPGATELCDGIDQNCDDLIDTGVICNDILTLTNMNDVITSSSYDEVTRTYYSEAPNIHILGNISLPVDIFHGNKLSRNIILNATNEFKIVNGAVLSTNTGSSDTYLRRMTSSNITIISETSNISGIISAAAYCQGRQCNGHTQAMNAGDITIKTSYLDISGELSTKSTCDGASCTHWGWLNSGMINIDSHSLNLSGTISANTGCFSRDCAWGATITAGIINIDTTNLNMNDGTMSSRAHCLHNSCGHIGKLLGGDMNINTITLNIDNGTILASGSCIGHGCAGDLEGGKINIITTESFSPGGTLDASSWCTGGYYCNHRGSISQGSISIWYGISETDYCDISQTTINPPATFYKLYDGSTSCVGG